MSIRDLENELENETEITVTRVSTNTIDLGVVGGRKIGPGETVQIDIVVTEDFTASGAGTMIVALVTDTVANLASPTVLRQTPALALATLVVGYHISFAIPVEEANERYLGLNLTIGTGPMTAGLLDGGIVMEGGIQTNKSDQTAVTGF